MYARPVYPHMPFVYILQTPTRNQRNPTLPNFLLPLLHLLHQLRLFRNLPFPRFLLCLCCYFPDYSSLASVPLITSHPLSILPTELLTKKGYTYLVYHSCYTPSTVPQNH